MFKFFTKALAAFLFFSMGAEAFVEGDLTQHFEMNAGEQKRGKIRIRNSGFRPASYSIRAADWRHLFSGESFFDPPGTNARSNAEWISLSSSYIVLPPNEVQDVYYTVRVPEGFSGKGAYWSLFLIEEEKSDEPLLPNQIAVRVRYANLVLTTLPDGESGLRFLKYGKDEKGRFFIDVENNGQRFLEPELTLRFFNEEGAVLEPVKVPRQKILPGSSVRYQADLNKYAGHQLKGFAIFIDRNGGQFAERVLWEG